MKNIILIAPPGAGKGTQAKMLCTKFNMVHISVGDLLRSEIEKKSDLSESLKQRMQSGKLVEDELILKIMEKRLNESDLNNGFILDGFPRNINQAINLEKITKKIDVVIYLEVSKEELERRKKTDFQDTWFVYVYWRMLGLISQEDAFAYNLEKNS